MENDKQINKKNVPKIVSKFITEDLSKKANKPNTYSINDEFAATKKNKSIGFYFFIFGFILMVFALTYFVTLEIKRRNSNFVIEIKDFEDINLKEILSVAKNAENQVLQSKKELQDLKDELNGELIKLRDEADNRISLILNKNMDNEERKKRILGIRWRRNRKIARVKKKYVEKIRQKEIMIAEAQKKLDAYDSRLSEAAKKTEELIDNYQKIHEIKLLRQKKYYEIKIEKLVKKYRNRIVKQKNYHKMYVKGLILKYNPVFQSETLNKIISAPVDKKLMEEEVLKPYPDYLGERVPLKDFTLLREEIKYFQTIFKRLAQIPYINSVKPALSQLHFLSLDILKKYEILWNNLAINLGKNIQHLQLYRSSIEFFAKNSGENGFVIGSQDKENILVFIRSFFTVNSGDRAYIYRNNQLIAQVRLFPQENRVLAKVVELREGQSIQPFDKILLHLKKGGKHEN